MSEKTGISGGEIGDFEIHFIHHFFNEGKGFAEFPIRFPQFLFIKQPKTLDQIIRGIKQVLIILIGQINGGLIFISHFRIPVVNIMPESITQILWQNSNSLKQ